MASVPNDPGLLRKRADEARVLAKNTLDLELSAQIAEIASIYERLAAQAETRKRRLGALRGLVGP